MDQDSDAAWQESLAALRDEVTRVTALMRSVGAAADGPALGQWNLGDIAAHLAHVWAGLPELSLGESSRSFLPTLDDLATFTTELNASDDERDLAVLADRIETSAEAYFASCAGRDPDQLRPWMVDGTSLPLSSSTCHLLNETVVHGWDIADAAGRRWTVIPDHARLALERFMLPVMSMIDPAAMVDRTKAEGFRGTYEFRIRGGVTFGLRFDHQGVHLAPGAGDDVDCHISVDPAVLLLLFWGRRGPWPAVLGGKLWVWGRRPWLAMRLPELIRNP